MSITQAITIIGDIEARLAKSSSDPKWLNDALSEVSAALEASAVTEPSEAQSIAPNWGTMTAEQIDAAIDAQNRLSDAISKSVELRRESQKTGRTPYLGTVQGVALTIYSRLIADGHSVEASRSRALAAAEFFLNKEDEDPA